MCNYKLRLIGMYSAQTDFTVKFLDFGIYQFVLGLCAASGS